MTVRGIRLEAEDADATVGAHQIAKGLQCVLSVRRREVRQEDPPHGFVLSAARSGASIGGSPERAKMEIVDAGLAEVRGKRGLREAGPPRHCHGPNVDEQLDLRT